MPLEWLSSQNERRAAERRALRDKEGRPAWGQSARAVASRRNKFRKKRLGVTRRIRLRGKGPRPRVWGHWNTQSSEATPSSSASGTLTAPAVVAAVNDPALVAAVTEPAVTEPSMMPDPLDGADVWSLVDQHMISKADADNTEFGLRVQRLRTRELQLDDEDDEVALVKQNLKDEAARLKGWERRLFSREQTLACKPRSVLGGGRGGR